MLETAHGLRAEQRRRHDGDPILAAISLSTRGDRDSIQQLISDLIPEPPQVAQVVLARSLRELDLDGDHATVCPFHDEVDLMVAPVRPQKGKVSRTSRQEKDC